MEQDISTSDGDRQAHTEPTPDLATVLNVPAVALNAAIVEDREFLDEAICLYAGTHVIQRVNTILELARAAGLTIDWADKYPTYDLVQGPPSQGSMTCTPPEINNAANPSASDSQTAAYDALKVTAVLNQLASRNSSGAAALVPAIFGMNFQALSVAQKTTGYRDALATPGVETEAAMVFVDASLRQMMTALNTSGLQDRTLIVISKRSQGLRAVSPPDVHFYTRWNDPKLHRALTGNMLSLTRIWQSVGDGGRGDHQHCLGRHGKRELPAMPALDGHL